MTEIAIVTGGNSGIGKAIVKQFIEEGFKVFIIGRDEGKLRNTEKEFGENVVGYQVDISKPKEIEEFVNDIVRQHNTIDILVNNAGFVKDTELTLSLEELEANWDSMVNTMLKGSFLMTAATVPYFKKPGGRIINISSIAAFTGGRNPGASGYAAAKAGIHGLTYGFARELSPQGITVNTIAPGFIADTGFTGQWPETVVKSFVNMTPVKRAGHVDDVAAAVKYLASPEASFISGEILNVNGGQLFGRG